MNMMMDKKSQVNPGMKMQAQSMAQDQMKVMSPQLPQGSMGMGKFQSSAMSGKMTPDRKFDAMKNLVSGKYKF